MALELADYETKAKEATMAFWGNREKARQAQIEAGKADQGERAGVTAGKNMDGFLAMLIDIVQANGPADVLIHQKRAVLTLPGYFRPTKLWDVLVMHRGHLIAAVELKSQVGPSFGNNLAQSAPSCDFGQVGERFGNVAFGIDDGNHRRGQFAPS